MLELGWGTPSLVTVRIGLLVEADQFTLLGQAIVALPPLVSADIALLYLRLDFVGSVVVRPAAHRVRRQADSLARRLISHHRPVRVPRRVRRSADVPHQRRRLPSALQGSAVRHSDAVRSRRRQPRHRHRRHRAEGLLRDHFGHDSGRRRTARLGRHRHREHRGRIRLRRDLLPACRSSTSKLDIYAYLDVHVFGIDFASIHLDGLLAGPGRWHIAGNAKVHTPWPLPDFSSTSTRVRRPTATRRRSRSTSREQARQGDRQARQLGAQLPQGGDGHGHAGRHRPPAPTCSRTRSARCTSSRSSCRSS